MRGAPGTVTYGLKLQAWTVFMMVMQNIPVERCADILESMRAASGPPTAGCTRCYASTARKQCIDTFAAIHDALAGLAGNACIGASAHA